MIQTFEFIPSAAAAWPPCEATDSSLVVTASRRETSDVRSCDMVSFGKKN